MVRILGIDPGSRATGYAVLVSDGAALEYVECGVLQPGANLALAERLGRIAADLGDVIRELLPEVVAVEDVFHSVNARSALALGQARGAALSVVGLAKLTAHSYAPALVKQTVTGRGRASKAQVAQMVCRLVGLSSVPQTDAADALAVAITHAHLGLGLDKTMRCP